MDDNTRKELTLYLGECWHYIPNTHYAHCGAFVTCTKCGKDFDYEYIPYRPFTRPDDMAAVREEIIKRGEWSRFEDFAFSEWIKIPFIKQTTFTQWLTDPETLIRVAGEWVGRKSDG